MTIALRLNLGRSIPKMDSLVMGELREFFFAVLCSGIQSEQNQSVSFISSNQTHSDWLLCISSCAEGFRVCGSSGSLAAKLGRYWNGSNQVNSMPFILFWQ